MLLHQNFYQILIYKVSNASHPFNTFAAVLAENQLRILKGYPASLNEFPYLVSLRRSIRGGHFCGGSLISQSHILTAAHCVRKYVHNSTFYDIRDVQVFVGSNNQMLELFMALGKSFITKISSTFMDVTFFYLMTSLLSW